MPAARCRTKHGATDELSLSTTEILASVESLYSDGLRPFGRLLLKRLRERAAVRSALGQGLPADAIDPETMPRIDPKRLRRSCQSCIQLCVKPEDGQEYSATLVGRPCSFIDVCSPVDNFSQSLWSQFSLYLHELTGEATRMPGGRYACALVLRAKSLPFFANFSLGDICHVIQLAVCQRRLLGYNSDGFLVPFKYSDAWVKEQCAAIQSPMSTEMKDVASWEEIRWCLKSLLDSEGHSCGLPISSVKRLFRSVFNLELSVTSLGHTRLLEVLIDPRLQDVCYVDMDPKGFMVRRALPMLPPGQWGHVNNACVDSTMLPVAAVPVMCLSYCAWDLGDRCEVLVSPGASPPGSAWNAHCSSPINMATDTSCGSDLSSLSDETESSAAGIGPDIWDDDICEHEQISWDVKVKGTFIHVSSPRRSHGSKQRSRSFH